MEGEGGMQVSAAVGCARQALVTSDSDGAALHDLPYKLIKEKAPFDGENDGAWQFMVCFNKDARGVCKTCSQLPGTVRANPFSVCYLAATLENMADVAAVAVCMRQESN